MVFSAVFVCTNICSVKKYACRVFLFKVTQSLPLEIQMVPPDLFIVKQEKCLLSEIIE